MKIITHNFLAISKISLKRKTKEKLSIIDQDAIVKDSTFLL